MNFSKLDNNSFSSIIINLNMDSLSKLIKCSKFFLNMFIKEKMYPKILAKCLLNSDYFLDFTKITLNSMWLKKLLMCRVNDELIKKQRSFNPEKIYNFFDIKKKFIKRMLDGNNEHASILFKFLEISMITYKELINIFQELDSYTYDEHIEKIHNFLSNYNQEYMEKYKIFDTKTKLCFYDLNYLYYKIGKNEFDEQYTNKTLEDIQYDLISKHNIDITEKSDEDLILNLVITIPKILGFNDLAKSILEICKMELNLKNLSTLEKVSIYKIFYLDIKKITIFEKSGLVFSINTWITDKEINEFCY